MANESIKQFVTHQISEQNKMLGLYAYDEHGRAHPRRYIFSNLEGQISAFIKNHKEPRWIVIPGLRGVGKTTVLAQLYFSFERTFKNRALYVSLDDVVAKLSSNLYEVLDCFEEILGSSFSALQEDVLLLVDEAHYDMKWANALKSLHDRSKRIFIVTTGSSAIPLKMSADVARRAYIEKMHPLTFTEYVMLSGSLTKEQELPEKFTKISKDLENIISSGKSAKEIYEALKKLNLDILSYWKKADVFRISKYLKYYSMPSVLPFDDEAKIYQVINSVVERIIGKDIPTLKVFSQDVIGKMQALLFMLAGADVVSLNSLSKNLGLEAKTLMSVFDALEKSELLLRIYPLGSIYRKVRKPSKYLFSAPCFRAALLNVVDSKSIETTYKGKLLEDAVGLYLMRKFGTTVGSSVSYDPTEGGADFILEQGKKKIVIEVGWNKKGSSQITKTMQRIGSNLGLLITNSPLHYDEENKTITLPLEYFFIL